MTEEQIETTEENEPIYYKPKALSMIATVAMWASWIVLVVFLVIGIGQIAYIADIGKQNPEVFSTFGDLQKGEQLRAFIFDNILTPLFTGITFFILLQAASIGLNSLLEIDFNVREMHS